MSRGSAVAIPVLLRFPPELAREKSWGRLAELSSSSACLSTLTKLSRYERVWLSFELAGERYRDLPAEVAWVERDADGFCAAEVRFLDEVEKRRLAKALLETLAR